MNEPSYQSIGRAWDQTARYVPWPRYDRAEFKPAIDGVVRGLDAALEQDKAWSDFVELWKIVNQFSALDIYRAKAIYDLLIKSSHIEGDICEFGTYMGGTGILMGLLARRLGIHKRVHLFDSFQGLPSLGPGEIEAEEYWEGAFTGKRAVVERLIAENGLQGLIVIHEGWFQESLPLFRGAVSFAHFDADIYSSTKTALNGAYPNMPDGAVLVFDDYFDLTQGVRQAVTEGLGDQEIVHLAPLPMAFIQKGLKRPAVHKSLNIEGRLHSIDYLADQEHWLRYYDRLIEKIEGEVVCMRLFQEALGSSTG